MQGRINDLAKRISTYLMKNSIVVSSDIKVKTKTLASKKVDLFLPIADILIST